MNRQARRWTTNKWEDFGAVTHAEAARQYAQSLGDMRLMRVMTRDDALPDAVFFHDVHPVLTYKVKSLRGDE